MDKRARRTARAGGLRTPTAAPAAEQSYEQPLVTVDVVILTLREATLQVLLMKRAAEPFHGSWALPGGYIHAQDDADLDAAARRILREKAGIETPYLEQLQGFGNRRRDPRGWTATFAYFALIASENLVLKRGANAEQVAWFEVNGNRVRPPLAFDHADILASALRRLRSKVEYTSLPVHLLPPKFTLPDLQQVYEQILGRSMDKSAFRKRMAEANFLEPLAGEKRPASNRPAQIYRIKRGLATIFFDRTI
jgi:ADP-ribose pyrophosphatase YjhB (NUDIX family)